VKRGRWLIVQSRDSISRAVIIWPFSCGHGATLSSLAGAIVSIAPSRHGGEDDDRFGCLIDS
jgi:hypothetical protein